MLLVECKINVDLKRKMVHIATSQETIPDPLAGQGCSCHLQHVRRGVDTDQLGDSLGKQLQDSPCSGPDVEQAFHALTLNELDEGSLHFGLVHIQRSNLIPVLCVFPKIGLGLVVAYLKHLWAKGARDRALGQVIRSARGRGGRGMRRDAMTPPPPCALLTTRDASPYK